MSLTQIDGMWLLLLGGGPSVARHLLEIHYDAQKSLIQLIYPPPKGIMLNRLEKFETVKASNSNPELLINNEWFTVIIFDILHVCKSIFRLISKYI